MIILYILFGYAILTYLLNGAMMVYIATDGEKLESNDWTVFLLSPLTCPAILFVMAREWYRDNKKQKEYDLQ